MGWPGLHRACYYNDPVQVSSLLQQSSIADVNEEDCGRTPLMVAVRYCSVEAAKLLLQDQRVELNPRLEEQVGMYRAVSYTHLTLPTKA